MNYSTVGGNQCNNTEALHQYRPVIFSCECKVGSSFETVITQKVMEVSVNILCYNIEPKSKNR